MNWFVAALMTGAIAFSATNLDDILFLAIFYSQNPRPWQVVAGQYLGFTALLLISLTGFFGGRLLPHGLLRWLGVAPIFLGLKKLTEKQGKLHEVRSGVLAVATVTFANGADNIGIYAPLFAVSDLPRVLLLIGVFYTMLAAWCIIAYHIHRHPFVAAPLRTYGHWLVPVVLISLGVYIFIT